MESDKWHGNNLNLHKYAKPLLQIVIYRVTSGVLVKRDIADIAFLYLASTKVCRANDFFS